MKKKEREDKDEISIVTPPTQHEIRVKEVGCIFSTPEKLVSCRSQVCILYEYPPGITGNTLSLNPVKLPMLILLRFFY